MECSLHSISDSSEEQFAYFLRLAQIYLQDLEVMRVIHLNVAAFFSFNFNGILDSAIFYELSSSFRRTSLIS